MAIAPPRPRKPNRRKNDFPNPDEIPDLQELGVSGTKLLAGLVFEEVLPQLQGLNAYRVYNGMRMDPTGAALLKSIEMPIRSARWFVQPFSDNPADVEKADFIHDMVYTFGSQSMDDIIRLAWTNKAFGFAVMEIVYEFIQGGTWDGKVGWDKLAWRHPLTKWRWNMGEVDGRQEMVSMTQLAPPYYEQIDIPRNKLAVFVYNREGDNFDGVSIFRPGYKSYIIRDNLYRIQAIGLERAYQGVPVVTIPGDFSDEYAALAKQIVTTVRTDEQAGVVVPDNMKFELIHWPLEGTAMQSAIEHHDTQMLASALADFLKLGHRGVGSLALETGRSDLFLDSLNGDANQFAEVMNLDPLIPKLIRVNFKDADDMQMPRLQHGDIGERNLERLGRTLMALGQWGFLTPDDATEDKLREMLDLPDRQYDFEDRDLYDILQRPQPVGPLWQIGDRNFPPRLRPQMMVPDPTDPRSAAILQQANISPLGKEAQEVKGATPKTPRGGGKPDTGGPGDFSEFYRRPASFHEAMDRYLTEQAKLQQIVLRNRWARPKGRMTEITRARVQATEKFTEALSDVQPGRQAPERPSVMVAKNRRPYDVSPATAREIHANRQPEPVRMAEAPVQRSAPQPTSKAVTRHSAALTRLLIPKKLRDSVADEAAKAQ